MRIIIALLISLCFLTSIKADGSRYASQSVLSGGKWVKIQVGETGIYKITYDDLKKMGFSDPSKVSVHGYGGWPLDEDFSSNSKYPYIDDLPAVAVYKGSDYLLFYGKGPVKWEYDDSYGVKAFVHTNNPYALYGAYFLTDSIAPKEMEKVASVSGEAALGITVFDDYRVHEEDLKSVNKSGRELFGESFEAGGSRTIAATSPISNIPGITDDEAEVTMRFIARPKSTSGLVSLSVDGNNLMSLSIPHVGTSVNDTYTKARVVSGSLAWNGSKTEKPKFVVSYNKSGDENVHLDYIRLHVKRELKQYGEYTFFRSLSTRGNVSRFILQNANANTLVFDITDGENPRLMDAQLNGSELTFTIPASDTLREFVAVQANQPLTGWTREEGDIPHQNLHAHQQIDMVIIAPDAFRTQAERLAERHRTKKDSLSVLVVSPQQIYNEFSSGVPDATAYRRFMKMFYDRNTSEVDKPKYLLLFGDGAYDNRGVTADWKQISRTNMLLTYQSDNSVNSGSYVTDDYFGALEDIKYINGPIQLGIGRFPVRTVAEATAAVDKVLSYMDNAVTGVWKNKLTFVADDGNAADTFTNDHMDQANKLADMVRSNHPEFLVNKIFFDAYKKNTNYPTVRANIQQQLKDGLLMINYTGHGNTRSWSDEDVLNQTDIAGFTYPYLPLWITATCDFTRFDDVSTSAGEDVFLKKSGGIALFTTTRVVYSNDNFELNQKLLNALFERNSDNSRLTLGDIMRKTKAYSNSNKLNFILIGDPAMKLAYPEYHINVKTVNGNPVGQQPDSLKAEAKVTITGEITDLNGNLASDFSGSLDITILDSKQTIKTLQNANQDEAFTYVDYPNKIYIGNDVVKNGTFEFSFTVPTDISYSNDYGILNLYAADDDSGIEAQGNYQNFVVGGSADNPVEDTEGPEIRQLYLNDTTFVEGGKVNTTPLFIARLWDQTGVNISGSSVGHDITLSISSLISSTTIHTLNSYYKLIPDSDGEGLVGFQIPALEAGMYSAEFRVWDVLNNSTVDTFTFEVVEGMKPVMSEIFASPVPARSSVQFYIYHNRPESNLRVNVMVFDMNGRLVWKREETGASDWGSPYIVSWDLRSSAGGRLLPGVYIYRAAISTDNSKEATKAKKLVILAQ
ncbi:hypothetical protein M2459_003588 [Parabacteroides sp. PF5-5]|uniref:type IX secretion system sortase PorU n=1 Tax=unclassified Parabacteroides TaxID=2649774 RepID=UPI00247431AE|nr:MULTISPECIES: type IX secretion system sortase PorU [unclassified Parabacteroides]MDH6306979.1 hypothetical protein [Parabacteroides sp. PH5-39]MDH6317853.1 hypothetical protein [Parabacteroides sp. PF5-13]MDH6321584.1 hypothetical protein [Parabacteroides sp. PH5-13]MDH6325340.1 hypothetical protein [Parabacteroides sp. PH5-8]MDH6329011.1 hypothetical protein [Parabacteroides sp. PH5-41]